MAKIISFGNYFNPKKHSELMEELKRIEFDYGVSVIVYQEEKLLSAASQMLDARASIFEAFKNIDGACKELGIEDAEDPCKL